ncbi:S49 family peptidase [Mesorhizobium sp. M0019]|uniref:S49 family peptidase n=1 Tax=Mesorhizobium sp. M0019 TaxID=2956845 RepID=UPI00333CA227
MRAYDSAMSAPWAMLPEHVENLLTIAAREHDPQALEAYRANRADRGERLGIRDNVAILNIAGPLFKRANLLVSFSGATSYEILRRDLQAALDDKAVDAIILNIDSPGGEASGCDELAAAIFAARAQKPITAYVSGMAASGGYWLAAAADRIVVSDAAILGSIGVVLGVTDRTKADERAGIARLEFVSSQSPGKRPDHTTDAGRARVQKLVDDLGDVFVTAVSKYRGVSKSTVLNDFGQGGMEVGANAVKRRMADEVGQFEATLRALSARGKGARSIRPALTGSMPPAGSSLALAAAPAALPAPVHVDATLTDAQIRSYQSQGLSSEQIAVVADAQRKGALAVRQRYSAFLALDDRLAVPALYAHLRDETDISADQAAKILKAAKEDLQALVVVIAVDPAEAYLAQKAKDGALGLDWHPDYHSPNGGEAFIRSLNAFSAGRVRAAEHPRKQASRAASAPASVRASEAAAQRAQPDASLRIMRPGRSGP